jgi:hypothetical protein
LPCVLVPAHGKVAWAHGKDLSHGNAVFPRYLVRISIAKDGVHE